jgi:hypothetical protein
MRTPEQRKREARHVEIAIELLLLALFIVAIVTPFSVFAAEPWTTTERNKQIAATTLLAVDMAQTLEIKHNPMMYEHNPLLGSRPSDSRIVSYFATVAATQFIAAHLANRQWRNRILDGTIAIQVLVVAHNHRQGLRIGGPDYRDQPPTNAPTDNDHQLIMVGASAKF